VKERAEEEKRGMAQEAYPPATVLHPPVSTGRLCRNRMLQKRKVNRSRGFSDFNSHPRDHRAVQFKLKRAVEAIGRECQVSRVTTVLRVIGDEQSKVVWKGSALTALQLKLENLQNQPAL